MVLRYMYIFSVSGLMNEGLLTKDQALQNIKFLEGKDMILASHPFHLNCTLNCTQISEDRKDTFRTCVTNNDGTQIFSFEYIEIKDGIKETVDQLEGKIIHIKANLSEVSVEGTILPIFRLNFSNGEYML